MQNEEFAYLESTLIKYLKKYIYKKRKPNENRDFVVETFLLTNFHFYMVFLYLLLAKIRKKIA